MRSYIVFSMSKMTDANMLDVAMQAHFRRLSVLAGHNGMKQTAAARKYQVSVVSTDNKNPEIHLK